MGEVCSVGVWKGCQHQPRGDTEMPGRAMVWQDHNVVTLDSPGSITRAAPARLNRRTAAGEDKRGRTEEVGVDKSQQQNGEAEENTVGGEK